MSLTTAQRVVAATKRRLQDVMKMQPEGEIPEVEDIEAWGKLFAAALVSGTVGEPSRTTLTHLQTEYKRVSGDETDTDVAEMCHEARVQLDGQARADWLGWAGEGLMPETAQKKREDEEREAEALRKQAEADRMAEEAAELERARWADEERAAEFERRRDTAEGEYLAGTINVDELERALDAIRDEEEAKAKTNEGEKGAGDATEDEEAESKTVDDAGELEASYDEEAAAPSDTARTVGTKRKERDEEDVEMRAVDGPVSPIATQCELGLMLL